MSMLRGAVTLLGLRRGPAATLAVMLLTVVVGLVAAHLGRRTIGRPSQLAFGLAQETGYGEMFFSVLTVWATGLLAWAAVRWRQAVLGAWAGAFVLLLLDDRLMLHERAGGWIREHVAIVPDHPTGELV
ncbi:hypothetical protein M1843_20515 [Isoptericola sp. 4D.3]|uniref:Uncharacterized protein n=1 Tax=Isoptericola peretonis TaxID=2918523 RepID=A0ABT0J9F3_9MICO|nr:hypothetical protein [Isoptericola sp. 4D.3]